MKFYFPLTPLLLVSAASFHHPLSLLHQTTQPTTQTYTLAPQYSSSLSRAIYDFFLSSFPRDMEIALSPFIKMMDDEMIHKTSPEYKINEDENKVELIVEVPGIQKEDINLDVRGEGRVLCISGKKLVKDGDSESESKFERSFMLGTLFDSSKITASLENGVLTIVAPKVQLENVQKIEIA